MRHTPLMPPLRLRCHFSPSMMFRRQTLPASALLSLRLTVRQLPVHGRFTLTMLLPLIFTFLRLIFVASQPLRRLL